MDHNGSPSHHCFNTWSNDLDDLGQWPFHCRSIAWACLCPNIRPWRPLPPDLGTFVGDSSGTEPVYGTSRRVTVRASALLGPSELCAWDQDRPGFAAASHAMAAMVFRKGRTAGTGLKFFSSKVRNTKNSAEFGFGVAMLGLRGWKVDKSPTIGLMYVDVILRYNSGSMAH